MAGLSEARQHQARDLASAALLAFSAAIAQASDEPISRQVIEGCIAYQAQRFNIDPSLMRAMAVVESSLRPNAVNVNYSAHGTTRDIGLLQINSTWLPKLAQYGISERDLYDPCTNAEAGAWILSRLFAVQGATWASVGAYNAACTRLQGDDCTRARARYAWKVFLAKAASPSGSAVQAAAPQQQAARTVQSGAVLALSSLTAPPPAPKLPHAADVDARDDAGGAPLRDAGNPPPASNDEDEDE